MIETVLVPKQRIKVVMDKNCKVPLEEKLKIKLQFDENSVIITGEGLDLYTAKNIVKAIARGFSPVRAFKLMEEDQELEILEIPDHKENTIRARLIGTKGRARRLIELYTKCYMSVYNKTVSLIGTRREIDNARRAIEMIIKGIPHARVYAYLETL